MLLSRPLHCSRVMRQLADRQAWACDSCGEEIDDTDLLDERTMNDDDA